MLRYMCSHLRTDKLQSSFQCAYGPRPLRIRVNLQSPLELQFLFINRPKIISVPMSFGRVAVSNETFVTAVGYCNRSIFAL